MADANAAGGGDGSPANGWSAYEQELFRRLVQATKLSNGLPAPGEDRQYCNSFPGFRTAMRGAGQRVLTLCSRILEHRGQAPLDGGADDEDRYERLVEASDRMLEQVDIAYDAAQGLRHTTQNRLAAAVAPEGVDSAAKASGADTVGAAKGNKLLRPQSKWQHEIDNSDAPFVPKLRSKPNAIVPLDAAMSRSLEAVGGDGGGTSAAAGTADGGRVAGAGGDRSERLRAHAADLGLVGDELGGPNAASAYAFGHPYDAEVAAFEPNVEQLSAPQERLYRPVHETPCTWVDTPEALERLCESLANVSEVAVDLEHHSFHSYRGFTCLMQLSTRDEDWLVDTLELRNELQALNEVFTNPDITKVLHGADSDVVWLQRDLSLYLVGLFDTGQAARTLALPSFALSFLLQHYCGVRTDKKFQLADWRLRPLTADMQTYARADTHYLLYIYDRLRRALTEAGPDLLPRAWTRSASVSRICYRVEPFRPEAHRLLLRRHVAPLSPAGLRVHRALFCWRDAVAREVDESPPSVLSRHSLHTLAIHAPRTAHDVLAAWGRGSRTPAPALVRARAVEIAAAVVHAVDDGEGEGEAGDASLPSEAAPAAACAGAAPTSGTGRMLSPLSSALGAVPAPTGGTARVDLVATSAAVAGPAPVRPRTLTSAGRQRAAPLTPSGAGVAVRVTFEAAEPSPFAAHVSHAADAAPTVPGGGAGGGDVAAGGARVATTAPEGVRAAEAAAIRASFLARPPWPSLELPAASAPTHKAAPAQERPNTPAGGERGDAATAAVAPLAPEEAAPTPEDGEAAPGDAAPEDPRRRPLPSSGAIASAGDGPGAGTMAGNSAGGDGRGRGGNRGPVMSLEERYGRAPKRARAGGQVPTAASAGRPAGAGGGGAAEAADEGAGAAAASATDRAADFMRKVGWLPGLGEAKPKAKFDSKAKAKVDSKAKTSVGLRGAEGSQAKFKVARGGEGDTAAAVQAAGRRTEAEHADADAEVEGGGDEEAGDFAFTAEDLPPLEPQPGGQRRRDKGDGTGTPRGAKDGKRPARPGEPRNSPGLVNVSKKHRVKVKSASFK